MRASILAMLLAAMVACVHGPTTQLTARAATDVNASFDRTWSAVIDVFAERNIPIATIDKSSGLIATTSLVISDPKETLREWADCGNVEATRATYNVLVRGAGDRSTVKVTVQWVWFQSAGIFGETSRQCVTRHVWEQAAEADIKKRAENATEP